MVMMPCEKCSEMVDAARAFCPACGHAFVPEEQRAEQSNYDRSDNTMQMGNTMYNQMLSDMGLNISKAPEKPQPEKRVEVIAPVATAPRQPPRPASKPAAVTPTDVASSAKQGRLIIWLVVGALLLIFGLALLVVLAAFLIYWLPAAR